MLSAHLIHKEAISNFINVVKMVTESLIFLGVRNFVILLVNQRIINFALLKHIKRSF